MQAIKASPHPPNTNWPIANRRNSLYLICYHPNYESISNNIDQHILVTRSLYKFKILSYLNQLYQFFGCIIYFECYCINTTPHTYVTHISPTIHTHTPLIPHPTSPYHIHHHLHKYTQYNRQILWLEQTNHTDQQLSHNTTLPTHLTQSLTYTPQHIHSSGTPTTNNRHAGWYSLSTSGKALTNQRPVFIPHPTTIHTHLYDVTTNNTTTK